MSRRKKKSVDVMKVVEKPAEKKGNCSVCYSLVEQWQCKAGFKHVVMCKECHNAAYPNHNGEVA